MPSLVRRVNAPLGKWFDLGGGVGRLELTHDTVFNQAVKPVPGDFVITDASGPRVPSSVAWTAPDVLTLLFIAPLLTDPVYLTLPVTVANYVTLNGFTMDPYGPILVPDPPWLQDKMSAWIAAHPAPSPQGSPSWLAWAHGLPTEKELP